MQETLVQSLVGEESRCRRATKPVRPNYWACALENGNCNCWAHIQQLLKPACPRAGAPQATARRSLGTTTRESLGKATKAQHSQNLNKIVKQ